ncbi:BnaA04g19550D [Brassica napus]|uniref:BnaA04g19550D protein n=1 Tax=Brassica napus TaxID=3708 RepID=A0A078HLI3_BRANA|nr:BnaA04g19550D [Brassica napus]
MKTSLRRLRGVLHKHESKDRRDLRFLVQKDELAQASQDVKEMRDCYDSLLSAAAATANSAYEFSESLRELGACLLEKTALNDDEESGEVLLMLGKLQFELQKLVDKYRSHIFQTITIPSESLLNELRIVEEMMRLCDEKRLNVYEGMLTRQREKGRSKGGKGETFTAQQLQQAHEEYDNETTLFVFRLKSLKQGQTRSLLTQAARHHAAQLCFFKKALNSLEEVEPHVQMVTESQHIDYHFSGLEDDDEIENNEEDDSDEVNDDGELSFEYRMNDKDQNADSSPSVSSQLGQSDITFPLVAGLNTAQQENKEASYGRSRSYRRDVRIESQSAPLFAENRTMPPSEKLLRMRSSLTRKFSTYALPTPVETARSSSSITSLANNNNNMASSNPAKAITKNIWYSSPLEARGPAKVSSRPMSALKEQVLRESNKNTSSQLPRPSSDGLFYSRIGSLKRRSFSGPITSKPLPNKPLSSTPRLYSGPIPRSSVSKLPKVSTSSPTASPTFVSTPKISELHELPRPPSSSSAKSSRVFGYSAPLVSKSQLLSKPLVSSSAAPLPIPPAITRSFSIPTSNLRATELDMSKTSLGANKLSTASPPLTPMSLSHPPPPSAITEHAEHLTMSKEERTRKTFPLVTDIKEKENCKLACDLTCKPNAEENTQGLSVAFKNLSLTRNQVSALTFLVSLHYGKIKAFLVSLHELLNTKVV